MSEEWTQEQLNEYVFGKKPVVTAKFYDREVLDVSESRKQNQRVMTQKPYVHLECQKEDAVTDIPVQPIHKQRYPREWEAYERSKQNELSGQVQNVQPEEGCAFIGVEAKAG